MSCFLVFCLFSSVIRVPVPVEALFPDELFAMMDQGVSVRVAGGLPGVVAGVPDLPGVPWTFALPARSSVASLEVSRVVWEDVPGTFHVRPMPPPTPLSLMPPEGMAVPEDPAVYNASGFWPRSPVLLSGTSLRNGIPTGEVLVFPYRWNPASGVLQRISDIELSVTTAASDRTPLPASDSSTRRMLIVTVEELAGVFDELAQRRHSEGILTEVVTMDEVLSASGGRDDAEALRNYIIAYKQSWGLDFVLLGGDTEHVPVRYAFAMASEAGFHPREDSLPCDLYYSDLDGNWDANGNGIFGEVDDEVDLYPDVWVGRVTVNDLEEAGAWFSKLVAYEDAFEHEHLQDVLFLAEVLWHNPFTDGGVSKNLIQSLCLPGFMNVTKLYQTLGNLSAYNTMMAMMEGQNLLNHNGHAWYNGMSIGPGGNINAAFLNMVDSDGRFSAVFYSIGCWPGAFDFDAVGEHFLTSPDGCGVSFIGNSSYGWGSPGNPAYGYSDILDRYFFLRLYQDRNTRIGQVLAEAKDFYIPYGRWENVYRWHLYQVNLLGDPSFRPYRKIPVTPDISHPGFVTEHTGVFPVQVAGCDPTGLLLCVHDQGSQHFTTILDTSGYHAFNFDTPPTGDVTVTLSGNGVRRTSVICPQGQGPGPVISDFVIDDTGGDGFLSPGDLAHLTLTLANQGTENLSGIGLHGQVLSGPVVLLENSMVFPDLFPGGSAVGSEPLDLAVDVNAANNQVAALLLTVSTQQGVWEIPFSLLIHAPGLYFASYSVEGDVVPEPGETFGLVLNIANTGLLDAVDATAVMLGFPQWVSFAADTAHCPIVPAGATAEFPFICTLAPEAPSPAFPWFTFLLESPTTSFSRIDSLRFTVGETGVTHDVESGPEGWSHGGTGDMWRITDMNSHSPDHSWQCGNEQGYQDGMNCWLQSPVMHLAPNSSLSFWTMFDVALYGSDGLYPILLNLTGGSADTLDFIGSGGALYGPGAGMGTGWVNFSYDLSFADPEDQYRIEFRFRSDNDGVTGLGFFLDDIVVAGGYMGNLDIEGDQSVLPVLGHPHPNPSGAGFTVPLNITEPGDWRLGVYDLAGRLVMSFNGASPVSGEIFACTRGLASGVYLVRLEGASDHLTRRVVVLR